MTTTPVHPLDRCITKTGRIRSWEEDPSRRLPVSCTTKALSDDRLFAPESVGASMVFASFGLRNGAGVAVHLSRLDSVLEPRPLAGRVFLRLDADHPDSGHVLPALKAARLLPPDSPLPDGDLIRVADSMEGPGGIEGSWLAAMGAILCGRDITIDLSSLRPAGTVSGHGLVASGPTSFMKVYDAIADAITNGGLTRYAALFSTLNEVLRRGGTYKNGAITLHLTFDHPSIAEFMSASRAALPWAKRCIDVDRYTYFIRFFREKGLMGELINGVKRGDLWLMKEFRDKYGRVLYGNVCLEVLLKSSGTCLLLHVNQGQCTLEDMADATEHGMKMLLDLHPRTGVGDDGHYLKPEEDRQVGLGFLGLANQFAYLGITYADVAGAFERRYFSIPNPELIADQWIAQFTEGVERAAELARKAGMDRALCIAPTASCSYQSTDLRGFACTPEISPPRSHFIDRDSGTFGVQQYNYPPDCEIASEVGYDVFRKVADGIVDILQSTGLFHGYSLNSWSDMVEYDEEFFQDWARSPQTSLYYAMQMRPDSQAKDHALAAIDESYHEVFKFDELDTSEEPACPINAGAGDFCAACAE